jgi:hypothetical protein
MADRIPPDFDADWYRTTFPDVELSGLDPAEHYRRFGTLMGRSANAALARRATKQAETSAPSQPQPVNDQEPEKQVRQTTVSDEVRQTAPSDQASAIIDRPIEFDPEQVLPLPAPARPGRDDGERISIEGLARGPFVASDCRPQVLQALAAYALMFGLAKPNEETDAEPVATCGADALKTGEVRLDNAWLVERSTLRLMIGGATEPEAGADPLVIRAYQASPASPNDLSSLGEGIQLPNARPVFHDLLLLHPLMPLLIELSDASGRTRAITLMPFPSLLPGGLHWAELRALQTEANPMDDFWSLSERLLQEAVGTADSPDRSISSIAVDCGSSETIPVLSAEVQEWLAAMFGLNLDRAAVDPDQSVKSARLSRSGGNHGFELSLPANFMPTLSSLITRRLAAEGADQLVGPYLVAEADTHRPRWSVLLPPSGVRLPNIPTIRAASPEEGAPHGIAVWQTPIGIALYRPEPPGSVLKSFGSTVDPISDSLTVVLDAHDPSRIGPLFQTIRDASPDASIEVVVRLKGPTEVLRRELNLNCGEAGWSEIPLDVDLRDIAKAASNELLLCLSDQVRFHDWSTLAGLFSLLQSDATAGSVSCVLLGEKVIKKQAVLEPASGGIFPSGISFTTAPHLSFAEPEVLEALPGLAYPVVANTLLLTLFRRSALAELPRPAGPVPVSAADIRIGLDLMGAGHRNWCTTSFGAMLSGPHKRRDCIDPFGGDYVQPERWADILGQVTLIRELI